jgi:DNA-binding GntR family transcriptional regulator
MTTINRHQTRTEYVIEHLKGQILNGVIKGGDALRQNAIAKELGVSHIPVREALLRLAEQGLVKLQPHKGAVVHELSSREIDELSALRLVIERDALRRALPKLSVEELDQASAVLERYESIVTQREDMEIWGDLNFQFHSILYQLHQYPATYRILRDLHRQSDRYIRVLLLVTGWHGCTHDEHRQFLECARARDIEAAESLLEYHIMHASETISQHLRSMDEQHGEAHFQEAASLHP